MTATVKTPLPATEIAKLTAQITGGGYKRAASKDAAIRRFVNVAAERGIGELTAASILGAEDPHGCVDHRPFRRGGSGGRGGHQGGRRRPQVPPRGRCPCRSGSAAGAGAEGRRRRRRRRPRRTSAPPSPASTTSSATLSRTRRSRARGRSTASRSTPPARPSPTSSRLAPTRASRRRRRRRMSLGIAARGSSRFPRRPRSQAALLPRTGAPDGAPVFLCVRGVRLADPLRDDLDRRRFPIDRGDGCGGGRSPCRIPSRTRAPSSPCRRSSRTSRCRGIGPSSLPALLCVCRWLT